MHWIVSWRKLEQFFRSGEAWQKNIMAIAKDGSPYWVNANIIPILDESGENIQFLSIDSDITARELTKKKYKETQQNLRNIENALDYSSVVAITNAKASLRTSMKGSVHCPNIRVRN